MRTPAPGLAALGAAVILAAPLPAQARLYVANQDDASVSVIDLATLTVQATVDLKPLGFAPNARPHHAQVEPDGSFWYLTLIGAGKVLKLDRENRVVGAAAMEVPGLLTLIPERDLLVVGRSMSAVNPPSSLVFIRRSDMQVLEQIEVLFPRPHALVADPRGGRRVYVASLGVSQLASVGVPEGNVKLVEVSGPAHGFVQAAVSPDGRWLALTAQLSSEVLIFDLADPAAPKLAHTIPMEKGPFEPVFSPDGRWLYVTNFDANNASVIATEDWSVAAVIRHPAFAQPHGIAVSADGRWLYVGNRHQSGGAHEHEGGKPTGQGTVLAICTATRQVVKVIPVGAYAAGMGLAAALPVPSNPACP